MGLPEKCVSISTYAEFRDDVKRFADQKYQCLIIVGSPGIGKSEAIRQVVGTALEYEGGKPTAYQFYCDLHEYRDCVVMLDDVAAKFYNDNLTNSYLKVLTDTRAVKRLRWPTATLSEHSDPPNVFETTSRVVILVNDWESVGPHVAAIESRAFSIHFDPSPTEVHLEVGRRGWFHDQEVFDWIWEHRRLIVHPDMRFYKIISEQRLAGTNWKKRGLEMLIGDEKYRAVAQLLEAPELKSNKSRAAKFVEMGFGSRSTFYDILYHFRFYLSAKSENLESPKLSPPKTKPVDGDK